jgi:hypothetical protein
MPFSRALPTEKSALFEFFLLPNESTMAEALVFATWFRDQQITDLDRSNIASHEAKWIVSLRVGVSPQGYCVVNRSVYRYFLKRQETVQLDDIPQRASTEYL